MSKIITKWFFLFTILRSPVVNECALHQLIDESTQLCVHLCMSVTHRCMCNRTLCEWEWEPLNCLRTMKYIEDTHSGCPSWTWCVSSNLFIRPVWWAHRQMWGLCGIWILIWLLTHAPNEVFFFFFVCFFFFFCDQEWMYDGTYR